MVPLHKPEDIDLWYCSIPWWQAGSLPAPRRGAVGGVQSSWQAWRACSSNPGACQPDRGVAHLPAYQSPRRRQVRLGLAASQTKTKTPFQRQQGVKGSEDSFASLPPLQAAVGSERLSKGPRTQCHLCSAVIPKLLLLPVPQFPHPRRG